MQYTAKSRKPPSRRVSNVDSCVGCGPADRSEFSAQRRVALVFLHVLFPYLLARWYAKARRALLARLQRTEDADAELDSLFASSDKPLPPRQISWTGRALDRIAAFAKELPSFETLTEDYLRSVHLAIFYLFGRYHNLSKRFTGIRFVRRPAIFPKALALQALTPVLFLWADFDARTTCAGTTRLGRQSRTFLVRGARRVDGRPDRSSGSFGDPPVSRAERRRHRDRRSSRREARAQKETIHDRRSSASASCL